MSANEFDTPVHPVVLAEVEHLSTRAELAHQRAISQGKGTNYTTSSGAAQARRTRELGEIAQSWHLVLAQLQQASE